ncbi:unnamed protein product, partial [Mesorhabditis spiculigera]
MEIDHPRLRRNKATTFLPDKVFDLSHAFVVPLKHVPIDGLMALKNCSESPLADISIPVCSSSSPGPSSPKGSTASADGSTGETDYKTLTSLPLGMPARFPIHKSYWQELLGAMSLTAMMEEPEMMYTYLLQLSQCYEAMAPNQKVVAFTSDMPVRKAFYGLVYNSTRTGLIVDSESYNIIGVLSVTDFVMVLMKLWKYQQQVTNGDKNENVTTEKLTDLVGCMPVARWKEHQKLDGDCYREFITVDVKDSLFHAIEILRKRRVHRLPVMDSATNDCMFILTHRRVLHYLWNFCLLLPKPDYMTKSIKELKLGCWDDIVSVDESTTLIDTLDLLIGEKISGVPVVQNGTKKVVAVYTRFDAIAVGFDEKLQQLNMSVAEAVEERRKLFGGVSGKESVVTVQEDSTFWSVLETFVEKNVHRLFAVDDEGSLKAVISLSDMIWYMAIRPDEEKRANNNDKP